MKCQKCGNVCSNDSKFCVNCGNKLISIKSTIGLKAKIFIFSCLGLSFLILLLSIVLVFFYSFSLDSIEKNSDLNSSEFISYMEAKGCRIIDMMEVDANDDLSYYYITDDNTCPYRASYIEIKENKFSIYDKFINRVYDNPNAVFSNRVNASDYYEYSTSGSEYRIAILSDNHLFYLETDKEYKSDALLIKQELGYNYEPNFEHLSYVYCSILLIFVLVFTSWWKLNLKFGRKGWICLIPFYNIMCLSKDIFGKMWYSVFFFIPLANTIYMFFLFYNLGKVFGKSDTYRVLLIFFSFILVPFIAFDDSKYLGPIK